MSSGARTRKPLERSLVVEETDDGHNRGSYRKAARADDISNFTDAFQNRIHSAAFDIPEIGTNCGRRIREDEKRLCSTSSDRSDKEDPVGGRHSHVNPAFQDDNYPGVATGMDPYPQNGAYCGPTEVMMQGPLGQEIYDTDVVFSQPQQPSAYSRDKPHPYMTELPSGHGQELSKSESERLNGSILPTDFISHANDDYSGQTSHDRPEPYCHLMTYDTSYSSRDNTQPVTTNQRKKTSRKLLREISFSDADSKTARNYGELKSGGSLPNRKYQADSSIDDESDEDIATELTPDTLEHMMMMMQELVSRGKVKQVAILSQHDSAMLASSPPWDLPHQDRVGLVKAVTCTSQNMIKISVDEENYMCFKHATCTVMGRACDYILVVQKTKACVVVGVARDNTPGSCLQEVSQLCHALSDKGW